MNLKSRPLCQPESYLGMLVSGIVIDDEMDGNISGHNLIDAFEEGKKLLMAMAWFAFGCGVRGLLVASRPASTTRHRAPQSHRHE